MQLIRVERTFTKVGNAPELEVSETTDTGRYKIELEITDIINSEKHNFGALVGYRNHQPALYHTLKEYRVYQPNY